MLTETERQAVIERIARHVSRFDDDTLLEMERMTDPGRYLDGVGPRADRPSRPGSLTRRQVVMGLAGGGVVMAATALGTAALVGRDAAADDEVARLRAEVDGYRRLEEIGLDAAAEQGLADVGLALGEMQLATGDLAAGLEAAGATLEASVMALDPELLLLLRQRVLDPGHAVVTAQGRLVEKWVLELERPLSERLGRRAELRRALAAPAAGAATAAP